MAVLACADPAGNADRFEIALGADIKVIGIDQVTRVADFAAQPNGKALLGRAISTAGLCDVFGKAEIAHPVRRFGQLAQIAGRGLKGAVHIPQRAGAAEAGKLKPRGGMALGDGAGLINPHKEKRHPLGTGAL